MSIYIIAEAGVNHNGSLAKAKALVDVAADAGADAVKFQTFEAGQMISRHAPKADYQVETTSGSESQLAMVRQLELSFKDHLEIQKHCRYRPIEFLSTPFDTGSVDRLVGLGVARIKIASGEITNAPLLLKIGRTGFPLIMSTGMATLEEIRTALGVLAFGLLKHEDTPTEAHFQKTFNSEEGQKILKEKVTLLHCTTEYPAPLEQVNLLAIQVLKNTFPLAVGYSDHTLGITIPIAAAALGAKVIEKHFTLDKNLPGPDHRMSLNPDELKAMVKAVREVEAALGSPEKVPTASEVRNKAVVRKSLVTRRSIKAGERFTEENLTVKRPGTGISPLRYWEFLNRSAKQDYQEDEVIT